MRGQPGQNTRPHARLPLIDGHRCMNGLQLNVTLIRTLRGSLMCLSYFIEMLSMVGCATRQWQTSGRLVQALNVCTVCYKFIWKNNRHEVSKRTITKEIKDGGLKMLSIQEFDRSLKLTWLRKILNSTPEWVEFAKYMYYKIDYLLVTDINYHLHVKNTLSNPFWRDVTIAYWDWYCITG